MISQGINSALRGKEYAAVILAGSLGALALLRELGKHKIPCIVIGTKYIQKSKYALAIFETRLNNEIPYILFLLPQLINIQPVLLIDADEYLQIIETNWERLIQYYKIPASLENKNLTNKVSLAK